MNPSASRQTGCEKITLAVATDFEVKQIQRALSHTSPEQQSKFSVIPVGVSCRNMSLERFHQASCSTIVSIGFAGALDPALEPGTCLVPQSIVTDQTSSVADPDIHRKIATHLQPHMHDAPLLHTDRLLASIDDKQQAHERSNCAACDMESGILAQLAQDLAIPFACVRVILDPATTPVPQSIANFATPDWTVADFLRSNLLHPRELPATAAILKHTFTASRALRQATTNLVEGLAV